MPKMLKLIMKNLFQKPATRLYPVVQREPFERTRGSIDCRVEDCIFCGICSKKCPADAIKVERKDSLWELNAFRCVSCMECVSACPKKCIDMSTQRTATAEKKLTITRIKPAAPAAPSEESK